MNTYPTYFNLFKYGRALVNWVRHRVGSQIQHGGFRSIADLYLASPKPLVQHYGYNNPAVLAVLISCMYNNRFGVTVGVCDKHSPTLRTILFLCCTHGHSEGPELQIQGLSWEPQPDQQLLAVHGTDSSSWRCIARDGDMKTRNVCRFTFQFSDLT